MTLDQLKGRIARETCREGVKILHWREEKLSASSFDKEFYNLI